MKLYVGNLSFSTTNQDLNDLFGEFGGVKSANIIEDRETGRSRGFAFVSMSDADGARKAISGMDGQLVDGRALRVNEAEERQNNANRGSSRRGW